MKIRVDVAEPQGFDAGDGTGVFEAELDEGLCGTRTIVTEANLAARIQTPKGETPDPEEVTEYWLVVNCAPVEWRDTRFSSLLLMPRYRVRKPPLESLEAGEEIILNGMWRADGKPWDAAAIEAAQAGTLDVEGVIVARVVNTGVAPARRSSPFDG